METYVLNLEWPEGVKAERPDPIDIKAKADIEAIKAAQATFWDEGFKVRPVRYTLRTRSGRPVDVYVAPH